ncbi:MAG TPA: ferritin family protein [Candidatus Limnocylindrales bacterium]|nr:ferritin family protein [Candidatus Limnocylindrales bacterium]
MPGFPRNFDRIVEQCLLMEIQAMNLYTILANRAEDDEAKRMLRFLAEMEESHVGRLVEIFSEVRKDAETALARVDIVKAFQEEAWRLYKARLAGAGLNESSPADEYLTFAIVAEAHAEAHYDRLSREDMDPQMQEIFRKLAREEAEHGEHLKRIQRMQRG